MILDWLKTLLPAVVSWPMFAVIFLIVFKDPLVDALHSFAQSEGSVAKFGGIVEVTIGKPVLAPQYRDVQVAASVAVSVDLSSFMSSIRDEGPLGGTVGYSTAYAVEIALRQKAASVTEISARGIYETAKDFDEWPGRDYEGSSLRGALKGGAQLGLFALRDWPDNLAQKPASAMPVLKIKGYSKIGGADDIIGRLIAKVPVMVAVNITNDFDAPNGGRVTLSAKPITLGGHSLCIVGYDEATKLLKFANMWGTEWGDKGFGYISVNDLKSIFIEGYVLDV